MNSCVLYFSLLHLSELRGNRENVSLLLHVIKAMIGGVKIVDIVSRKKLPCHRSHFTGDYVV